MKINNLVPLNLQFFGGEEEISEQTQESADPETLETANTETENSESESGSEEQELTEDGTETPPQTPEENAKFAAIRRRAEEEAKAKADAKIFEYNKKIAELSKGLIHPVTQKPISSLDEYLDAFSAQEKLNQEAEWKQKGIDPSLIEQIVSEKLSKDPVLQEAKAIRDNHMKAVLDMTMEEGVREISKIDPSIKTLSDLEKSDPEGKILEKVGKGYSIADAYFTVNREKLLAKQTAAAKQGAINQSKSTGHMKTTDGVADNSSDVDVPESTMKVFRAMYGDSKTPAEIKKMYNTELKN